METERDAGSAIPRHQGQEHGSVPQAGKQVILFPDNLKTGELVTPFEASRETDQRNDARRDDVIEVIAEGEEG